MTRYGWVVLALGLSLVSFALTLALMLLAGQHAAKGSSSTFTPSETNSAKQVTVLVDDFVPQPLQGKQFLLHDRLGAHDMPKRGYQTAAPWVAVTDYPVFAYPDQPVTVTVAWDNIPTDGRYMLRVQLENKLQWPHYYTWTDIISYSTTETRTITIPAPADAGPRCGSRFVAAFISPTVTWNDVLVTDFPPRDVTIESDPPSGWISGQFHLADPYTGTFLDPEGQPFYVQGMTYAYEKPDTITEAVVISELAHMKALGFNAVNLYPRSGFNTDAGLQSDFLPEILSCADHNRMAVYIRPGYKDAPEFPDYMDPQYRQQAKDSLEAVLNLARPHPSVLAVDLDHRWLLGVDWWGNRRYGVPQLTTYTLAYLPTWLQGRFGTIDVLNTAWGKDYITFTNVLTDPEIVPHGQVIDLEMHPWRVDLLDYTLWAMDDFMADVTSYARTVDPDHLGTYTNDRAEVIPFPISTRASSGIDFVSPAHYNFENDFYRDWTPRAKLTQETLWQHNLYGLPIFVRESGWRTTTLSQTPPLTDYAWSLSDTHKAELYLRQATLMAVYPWIPGWAYFKWYDKLVEGDFGFLNDDGSHRAIATLAECINPVLPVNTTGLRPPERWIYYPQYTLAAPYAAYEHYKTLAGILEQDFFSAYEERIAETLNLIPWPLTATDCATITNTRLFTGLVDVFNEHWQPFAFTSTIPGDDLPIFLAGRPLELLSSDDRDALAQKRTVTFGPVGTSDERFHSTTPWYAEIVNLTVPPPNRVADSSVCPTTTEPTVHILSYPVRANAGRWVEVGVEWCNLPANAYRHYDLIVQLENKVITPNVFYVRSFTDFDLTGTSTVTLDIDPQHELTHTQPITGGRYLAALISKTEGWGVPPLALDAMPKDATIQPRRWITVTTSRGLVCPAWTGWTVQPLNGTYRTLATFQGGELDGQPAIVQSPDGRRTAFLYDVLSWKPIVSDLERPRIEESLACHRLLLASRVYLPLVMRDYP